MTNRNQHVVPRGSGWAVKPAGSSSDSSQHHTQSAAIDAARRQAIRQQSEVVIHRPDGTIRDKDSYGNDNCPPKDKKH
jgi:hypothetical protein